MSMLPRMSIPAPPGVGTLHVMTEILRRATPADRATLHRLWLMFRHDMSEFRNEVPGPDGTFRADRLDTALTDPDWAAYLVVTSDRPVGLALVRGIQGDARIIAEFFVVRARRRHGLGLRAVEELIRRHPAPWRVAFQEENAVAAAFWRRVAHQMAGDDWTAERFGDGVDVWLRFL